MTTENQQIEVILVRMEGKIDRMGDRMGRYEQDIAGVRSRIHDLSNEITPIVMLDLPGRIRTSDQTKAEVESRLNTLENIEERRKGAAALAKLLYGAIGALGVGGVAAVLRLIQVGGI